MEARAEARYTRAVRQNSSRDGKSGSTSPVEIVREARTLAGLKLRRSNLQSSSLSVEEAHEQRVEATVIALET